MIKYVLLLDEIGFYTDPTAYARPVKDVNANYVAESFNSLSSMQTVSQGTELRLVSGKTPYGSALSIVPTKTRSDNTWDHIIINKDSEWRLDSTEGIAMYVRMPGGISETQVTVMLYLNDSLFYPNNTGPVYYVPKNSDGSVVRVSSRQTLYDKVGFEGWVFIPYSSLTAHNGGKINVDDLQNRSSFQIRISHYRLNEDELYKDFIFDEVGFYSDQPMYIDAVKGKYGMSDTASNGNYIANSGAKGIKLQLLHVLKNTKLAQIEYTPLTMEEYFYALKECLINIPPEIVIHRLTGDGDKKILIAPLWSGDKHNVLNKLNEYMIKNNVIQGSAVNG